MFTQGNCVLPRSFFDPNSVLYDCWQDPETFKFLWYLISQASIMDNPKLGLHRGQLIRTLDGMVSETSLTKKKIRGRLEKLSERQIIVVKTAQTKHLITICDFESYQAIPKAKGTRKAQERHGNGTETAQEGHGNGTETAQEGHYNNSLYSNNDLKQIIITNNDSKNHFLKSENEKKVFDLEKIKNDLNTEGVFMTAEGYEAFKNLNEDPDSKYNYNGGLVESAKAFLKLDRNAKYRAKAGEKKTFENLEVASDVKQVLQLFVDNFQCSERDEKMLRQIKPILAGDTLELYCPNKVFAEVLSTQFCPDFAPSLQQATNKKIQYKWLTT